MEQIRPPKFGEGARSTQSAKCDGAWVASRIEMLLSAYRRDDYADPIGFVTQLGVVLEKYPEWVVRYVTSPDTGIQRTSKFPPSIAEVVSACEEIYAGERFVQEWDRRAREQIEERKKLPNWAHKPNQPQGRVVTFGEAQKIMQENRGIKIIGVFDAGRTIPYRG
jgi:hypothetical protein